MHHLSKVVCLILLVAGLFPSATVPGTSVHADAPSAAAPRIEDRLPWHGEGIWLQGDLHTHNLTRSDLGRRIVHHAARNRLDFIASTEHAEDLSTKRTLPALTELRLRFPKMLILAGMEWNMPGAGHASMVVDSGPGEVELLIDFARRFDRKVNSELRARDPDIDGLTWGTLEQSIAGLRWLERRKLEGRASAVLLNHPSRDSGLEAPGWRKLCREGLAGVEAAPGHQKQDPPGGADTRDRHEPMIASVGGDYDRLLRSGERIALVAGSDFHSTGTSHYPGAFSRTLVYAPERSAEGVILGLQAGATATVLGNVGRAAETRASSPGLDDHAEVGETLVVPVGAVVTYSVLTDILPNRVSGATPAPDRVEFISDFGGRPELVHTSRGLPVGRSSVDYVLPPDATEQPGSFYLRARVRRVVGDGRHDAANADLLVHVAATRVRVEPRR